MRDCWYGDNRDLVKWVTLIHLANENQISTILQVAMYRQEESPQLVLLENGKAITFPSPVQSHFPRLLDDISRLAHEAHVTMEVFKQPFARPSDGYFDNLNRKLDDLRSRRLVVFLDPDTGMAPAKSDRRHIRKSELVGVFSRLKPQDWLVRYQHKHLFRNDWIKDNCEKFQAWLHKERSDVSIFSSPIAKDVVFFALQKTKKTAH